MNTEIKGKIKAIETCDNGLCSLTIDNETNEVVISGLTAENIRQISHLFCHEVTIKVSAA